MKVRPPWPFLFWRVQWLYRLFKAIDLSLNSGQTYCRSCERWSHGSVCSCENNNA